jgi:hypothetical protein
MFEYDSKLHIQIFGAAIGTNFAIVNWNIYLNEVVVEIWMQLSRQANYQECQ